MIKFRESRVLRVLRDGNTALCVKLNLSDTRNAEIAAMSGVDCLWIDMEHTPNDLAAVENIVRAAKIYDCDVVTRVKKGSYSDFISPLEADSAAVMIPHLMSLEEAKKIVYYTKFYPVGRRPIDGGNADGAYAALNGNEYIAAANKERFVIVQIEDPEPLAELEEICKLDGIDMLFFGPADFSQGIGAPNDFANPEVQRVRELVASTAIRHGKYAGTVATLANYKSLIELGYNFLSIGADVVALAQYYRNIVSSFRGGSRD